MTFEDWRDVDPREVEPLYAAECERYRRILSWDYEPSSRIIEDARRAGRLPGLVLRSTNGSIAGWSFYMIHEGVLQIGGLVADSAARLRRLIDRVLQSPEAAYARGLSAFVFPVSSSLQSAFERQRFSVERHPYLSRSIVGESCAGCGGEEKAGEYRRRRLMEVDPADIVRVTARAYAGVPEARCFAADGRLDQWAHYLGQLLATPACGRYLPDVSFAIERRESRQLVGAVIATAVAPDTAHIAQIVVDPSCRRAGLANGLIDSVITAARDAGYSRLSLIVSESNIPAGRLYARLGFEETASFIYASRGAPTRRATPPPLSSRDLIESNLRSAR
jgi:ribosomal protein S18 acetylase RimI-like enzyme